MLPRAGLQLTGRQQWVVVPRAAIGVGVPGPIGFTGGIAAVRE